MRLRRIADWKALATIRAAGASARGWRQLRQPCPGSASVAGVVSSSKYQETVSEASIREPASHRARSDNSKSQADYFVRECDRGS